MTALAAGLALLGSLFFATGAALQQYEAARSPGAGLGALLRRPRWLLAAASMTAGGALHIGALRVGPLTVVQPMGVAALLFALPIAAALHGRRVARAEIAAAGMVAAGLAGIVLLVPAAVPSPALDGAEAGVMLAAAALTALACRAPAARAADPGPAALLAVAAGVLYGSAATLVRVLAEAPGLNLWLLAVVPFPAVAALALLQRAYACGHFGVAFASVQLADPLTAVACGALLLGEPLPASPAVATAAGLLAAAGTVALARTATGAGPGATTPRATTPLATTAETAVTGMVSTSAASAAATASMRTPPREIGAR
ncbi:hypothetical protein GCM10009530_72870 [Microbispora corallina]|uniref:hypothetical protein n=1 Tax=Microbispora corallina TaxID=83302 RepID=UPI0031DEDA4C